MEGNGKKLDPKKPASGLKKNNSFKAESETQTAVAVRVPSFNQKEANEAAEKIVTDEQAHSASMARKRRLMTKNRAQSVRTREKTPEPSKSFIPHEDTTTTDEDDPKAPRSQTEKEADDIYAEMRRKLLEKSNDKDEDDLDIDAIQRAKYEEAKERRRRSISPFALPTSDEIDKLQRRGSFIDPGNKLLSTIPTYVLTPKDETDLGNRKNSLVRDEGIERRDSLIIPPSPTSPGKTSPIQHSTSPSPQKPERPISVSDKSAVLAQRTTNQPNTQSIKQSPVTSKPKQSSLKQSTNTTTSIIKRPQDPIQNITSVSSAADNINSAPFQKSEPSNVPPVKPKRSKSGTRSQGRTSESEMSEDQSKNKIEQQTQKPPKPKERRRTIAAIKRSVRERSPAKRSRSAVRADKPLDVTGIELTKAGSEIIDLLEKARRRSISIPDEDLKLSNADNNTVNKSRQLMTPNKTPSTPNKSLKITSPKKIEIMSQEEMMESFIKAQRKSMEIERSRRSSGYVDASQSEITSSCYSSSYSEDESDFDITKRSAELTRKLVLLKHEKESSETKEKKDIVKKKATVVQHEDPIKIAKAEANMSSVRVMFRSARRVWKVFKVEQQTDYDKIKALRNRCFNDFIILLIFCGIGGVIFRYTEGAFENFYKCGVRRVKRDFIDSLWQGSHNMREDDWKSMARKKLWDFESQLHTAHEAGVHSYSGQKSWSFLNSVVYCLTVVTTIGYGHIAPSTTTGRAITIVYAVFGIPLFLILLADFGKLFTRCIKFLWAFVRRLYYTGSCRKVRKTVQVQEVMKGLNMVYEAASTFRRPSQYNIENPEALEEQLPPKLPPKPQSPKPQTPSSGLLNIPPLFKRQASEEGAVDVDTSIQTPAPSVFEIDDEFNLPISVAITCLIIYIFFGASIYVVWEDWSFFESFYFVFISMSTIGFGDFVPNHPMYMMGSIIYLVFGMALTSMCINVVQVKLSDSFRQASAKIGATIGLRVSEEDGSMTAIPPAPVEIPAVHGGAKTQESDAPVAV